MLNRLNIGICCLQETEVAINFPENVLNCGGFYLELELSTGKKCAGILVKNGTKYVRRNDLEVEDFHIVIVDIMANVKIHIINVYRSFRPPNQMTSNFFFAEQLKIITGALCANCYVMGDFNLDAKMLHRQDYQRNIPLKLLTDFALANDLSQLVEFSTWTRTINGVRKDSILNHIYVNSPATNKSVYSEMPPFGDHVLVVANLNLKSVQPEIITQKRNWKNYSAYDIVATLSLLIVTLGLLLVDFNVQEHWNVLDLVILEG